MKKSCIFLILLAFISLLLFSCFKNEYVKLEYDEKFISVSQKPENSLFIKNNYYFININKYYIKRPIIEELVKVKVIQNDTVIKELYITQDITQIQIKMISDTTIVTLSDDKSKSNGIILSEEIYKNLNYSFSINNPLNLVENIKIDKRRAMLDIPPTASITIKFNNINLNDYPNYSIFYINGKPVYKSDEYFKLTLKTNLLHNNNISLNIELTINQDFILENKEYIYFI